MFCGSRINSVNNIRVERGKICYQRLEEYCNDLK